MTRKRIRDEEGSNLNEIAGVFIWKKKKIESKKDVVLDNNRYSKKQQRERMAEIEQLRKRRDESAIEKAHREEERAFLARERAREEFPDDFWERKEQDFLFNQSKLRSEILRLRQQGQQGSSNKAMKEEGGDDGEAVFGDEVNILHAHSPDSKYCPRKPKYSNRVHTGYEWNKYNRTHYDHDNPPPKMVQGYKFNIFYPDLDAKSKAPTYTIENDGHSSETCIIRFHAGPPYEDLAFRIVNQEWDHSRKKGFKCAFERGILHLYFNFKRFHYRG